MVSAATRRQRQMAWVPAVGMSVIPQREREGEERESERERGEREEEKEEQSSRGETEREREIGFSFFPSNLWFGKEEAAHSEEISGNMRGAR